MTECVVACVAPCLLICAQAVGDEPLRDKTLVVWAAPSDLDQQGVKTTPIVYGGCANGGTEDGRRDLIIERVAW